MIIYDNKYYQHCIFVFYVQYSLLAEKDCLPESSCHLLSSILSCYGNLRCASQTQLVLAHSETLLLLLLYLFLLLNDASKLSHNLGIHWQNVQSHDILWYVFDGSNKEQLTSGDLMWTFKRPEL